jgi:CHASE2 domain-containing sensor protein
VVSTSGPYVGLDYFGEEDADLFFGRDAERKRIIGNLRATRLTLLYAESGVGKSSLLRAGVSARLRQFASRSVAEGGSAHYLPVVVSSWRGDSKGDLISALEAAARPLLPQDGRLTLRRDTLEGAIEDVVAALDATPLVILDQFEERVLYEANDEFDDEFARCVNRRDLRANFLISVREDAYSLIGSRFKSRIANVYGNYLHLDFLDAAAARDAVLEPLKAFNRRLPPGAARFEVEPALVNAVLEQVRRGRVTLGNGEAPDVGADGSARVETAYLQLVMKRLWDEEIGAGSQRLRLKTLRRLGGADTIVHGHLDEVMAMMPGDQRDAAAEAFRFLVTSGGRKIALSSEELREFSEVESAPLEPALKHLERQRILRQVSSSEPGAVARHEIYHDVLAPAILDWRRRHVEELTQRRLTQVRERARRLEVRNRRLAAAVIALTVVGVTLVLYLWDPTPVQRLELGAVDARFSVRGARAADSRLLLIEVDDKTLAGLGRTRGGDMSTANYARLLNRLRQAPPMVIAFDTVFEDDAADTPGGPALRTAMRATGPRLVLACRKYFVKAKETRRGDVEQVEYPELLLEFDQLKAARVRDGYRGLPMDVDAHNRRGDYRVELFRPASAAPKPLAKEVKNVYTFAFAAANIARGGALKKTFDDLPTASRRVQGEQSKRTTWIDYAGPPGTVRHVSAIDVLAGRVRPGEFAGKVVVIGVTARGNREVYRTPLGGGRRMSNPEVQANAIETMLRGGPLRDGSRLIDILPILALACVPALASLSASRAVRVAAIVGSAAVFLAVAQLAFNQGRIIAVALPLAALAASAAGMVASRMVRRRGIRWRIGSVDRPSSRS